MTPSPVPAKAAPLIQPAGRFRGFDADNRKHLEPEEVVRLFKALEKDPYWYAYFRVQYYYGMRTSEVALLLREDVNLKKGAILVRRLKARNERGFREHSYQLPPALCAVIKKVPQNKASPWLFTAPGRYARLQDQAPGSRARLSQLRVTTGGYRSVGRVTAHRRFKEACAKARIPAALAHTHVLRHTRATLLIADGMDLMDVSNLLGHSSLTITQKYVGWARKLQLRTNTLAHLGMGDLGEGKPT